MALVASQYGYSGNMERITKAQAYQKTGGDSMSQYYFNQKKILEINPGHPLIKELLKRVESDAEDPTAKDSVTLMFESATIRSGYEVGDSKGFADRIERMLRSTLNISPEEKVEEEPVYEDDVPAAEAEAENVDADEEPSSVNNNFFF
jgi:heat shock protein beta